MQNPPWGKCFTILHVSRSPSSTRHPCGLWHSPSSSCRCSLCLSLLSGGSSIRMHYCIRARIPLHPSQSWAIHTPSQTGWKGPPTACAALWRSHYFLRLFPRGFVGRESLLGPCDPCGCRASSFPDPSWGAAREGSCCQDEFPQRGLGYAKSPAAGFQPFGHKS